MSDLSSPSAQRGPGPEDRAASAGGTGAPPEPGASNHAPGDLTRTYDGRGIRVLWYAGRCIHSAACIRALPVVFDSRRRPWIDLAAPSAEADAVAEAVMRCPTGALHFERLDGGPSEPVPERVQVTASRDGPYIVRGPVEVRDEAGTLLRGDTRMALCRCGRTRHEPFCDNTHREIGFRSARAPGAIAG